MSKSKIPAMQLQLELWDAILSAPKNAHPLGFHKGVLTQELPPRDLPGAHPETLCYCGRCYLDGTQTTTWEDFVACMREYEVPLYPQENPPEGRAGIYVLVDPRFKSSPVRYVGLTGDFKMRYYAHCYQLKKGTHKTHWVRAVMEAGFLPIMIAVDEVPWEERGKAERRWVEMMRSMGYKLTNGTMGGETGLESMFSLESRRRLSASVRQRVPPVVDEPKVYRQHTPESAAKIIAANKGEANHQAKLTWEQVREMRRLMAEGVMNIEVAEMFNISITQVCRIRLNKSWREST